MKTKKIYYKLATFFSDDMVAETYFVDEKDFKDLFKDKLVNMDYIAKEKFYNYIKGMMEKELNRNFIIEGYNFACSIVDEIKGDK